MLRILLLLAGALGVTALAHAYQGAPPPCLFGETCSETASAQQAEVTVGSCFGHGGVLGLEFWGAPEANCNGIRTWGRHSNNVRPAEMFGSCVGQNDEVRGVRFYGPTGATCMDQSGWGVYSGNVDVSRGYCSCTGRGNVLINMVLWGPRDAQCGGFPEWGKYDQYCVEPRRP